MRNKNTPYTYEEVKKYIESFNYRLLSEEYKNANTKILIQCDKGHEPYLITFNSFKNQNNRCPYCCGRLITKEKSVGFLYPEIARMMVEDKRNNLIYDDTYKIAQNTHTTYYFKCFKCNKSSTRKKNVADMIRCNCPCEFCSDGISIPEKFMINTLNQLEVEYITQYNPKWTTGKMRYDFYIPSLNIIIETHGLQHYEDIPRGRSLQDEQENDKRKKELALNNEINKYIIIDCRKSEFDWLKENVFKNLKNIFNLNNVNWDKVWKNSLKSLVLEVCSLWKEGLSIGDISKKVKLSTVTIRKYLAICAEIDLCDYTPDKALARGHSKTSGKNNSSAKSVICLTTKEIFLTMKDGANKYNIKSTGAIPACCKGYVIRKGKKKKLNL